MNIPANAASRTSSTPARDTLRPRARRLISGLSDDEDSNIDVTSAPSTRIASPRGSRQTSPLPGRQHSKTNVRDPPRSTFQRDTNAHGGTRVASQPSFTSIWGGSWSGLQGFASSILGGQSAEGSRSASKSRQRTVTSHKTAIPAAWGPASAITIQVGAGTSEDRETMVRAAKRKELLRANGHTMVDASGRHKRRTSDDFSGLAGSVQPTEDDDRDALVYLHHVQPQDTFIGLTIKYNCQPAVIRKANRLWPNDPIQSRKTILFPVEACGVKGKQVSGPEEALVERDLLGDGTETLSMHESPKEPPLDMRNGWHPSERDSTAHSDTLPSSSLPPSLAVSVSGDTPDIQWTHESWVMLPNETSPTEIARLPRRHLGYFPRARRKSNPYSDLGTPRLTPTASLDLPRIPPSPGSAQSEAFAAHRHVVSRNRSSSNTSQFPSTSLFQGPGGVGSLGRNTRTIGPARDRLNELLGPHLPNVAPPPNQTVFTPWNPGVRDEDLISFANDTANTSYADDPNAAGVDFQEMTGKVERWVRKTVKRAGSAYTASANAAAQRGTAGIQGMGVGSGVGDLIELTDAFEIGDGDESHGNDLIDVGHGGEGSSAAQFGGDHGEGVRGRRMARDVTVGRSSTGSKGKED